MPMMADFLRRLWQREGHYSNHPDDPGGRTQWGISAAAFPEAWAHGPPTQEDAAEIYTQVFYTRPGLDKIPDLHLREQVFDFGVNAGVKVAMTALQRVVGAAEDGRLGPETLSRIAQYPAGTLFGLPIPGTVALNLAYEAARSTYYSRLVQRRSSLLPFLSGWLARAAAFRQV